MDKDNKLSTKSIISYASGDIFGGGAFTLIGLLFLNFLTDSALISGTIAGSMLLIGKIWDAVIDPFIGNLSDKTKSKYGKRRVFFLAGIFHISACFAMLWVPLNSALWVKVIYYTLAYMLFATSFSMTMVPYHALLAEMTKSYTERNKLVGVRAIFSNVSNLIAGVVPMIIIKLFADAQNGWFGMGIIFGIFYAIPWIFVFLGTKDVKEEPPIIPLKENDYFLKSWWKNAKIVFKNKSYRLLLGIYIASYTAIDTFMAINIYFIKDYLNMRGSYTIFLGIFIIAQILSVPLFVKISSKKGKKTSLITGILLWAGTLIIMLLIKPNSSIYFMYTASLLMGIGASGVAVTPWGILPETMDVEELISSKRREGIYSGFMTFIRQISQAVALFLTGIYIDIIGYQIANNPNEEIIQTTKTAMGIKLFYSLCPTILLLIALYFTFKYPLNPKTFDIMQKEIDRLKNNGSKEDVDAKTKAICEGVTGIKYKDLYK